MTSAQAMLLEEPLPRGRRWRERRQRDQRWRNSALLAFVLALLAHLLLLRLWWVDSPLPGLTLPRMPAISVRLFDPRRRLKRQACRRSPHRRRRRFVGPVLLPRHLWSLSLSHPCLQWSRQ